jgi:hypothetical protein
MGPAGRSAVADQQKSTRQWRVLKEIEFNRSDGKDPCRKVSGIKCRKVSGIKSCCFSNFETGEVTRDRRDSTDRVDRGDRGDRGDRAKRGTAGVNKVRVCQSCCCSSDTGEDKTASRSGVIIINVASAGSVYIDTSVRTSSDSGKPSTFEEESAV